MGSTGCRRCRSRRSLSPARACARRRGLQAAAVGPEPRRGEACAADRTEAGARAAVNRGGPPCLPEAPGDAGRGAGAPWAGGMTEPEPAVGKAGAGPGPGWGEASGAAARPMGRALLLCRPGLCPPPHTLRTDRAQLGLFLFAPVRRGVKPVPAFPRWPRSALACGPGPGWRQGGGGLLLCGAEQPP